MLLNIPCRAIAAGAGIGRLNQAVDGFDTAIGQPAVKSAQDPIPVRPNRSGELAERCEAGSLRPCQPRGQQFRGLGLAVGLGEDVPQLFLHPERPRRLELPTREVVVLRDLRLSRAMLVLQPHPSRSLVDRFGAHFGAPDLFQRRVGQLHDMEAVEGDLGLG